MYIKTVQLLLESRPVSCSIQSVVEPCNIAVYLLPKAIFSKSYRPISPTSRNNLSYCNVGLLLILRPPSISWYLEASETWDLPYDNLLHHSWSNMVHQEPSSAVIQKLLATWYECSPSHNLWKKAQDTELPCSAEHVDTWKPEHLKSKGVGPQNQGC